MKICMFANSMSVHTQRWAKALAQKGHEVHLFSINNYVIDGVNVHPVNIGSKNPASLIKKFFSYSLLFLTAAKRIRQLKPDVVNAHYVPTHGVIAAFANYHPLIISLWGADVIWKHGPRMPWILRMLLRYALKKANLICSTSKFMAEKTLEFFQPDTPIEIIPFGIDCKLFKPADKRKEYENQFRIGFVKTLLPEKGPHFLLKAMPIICRYVQNARLIIAGKGKMRRKLHHLASQLGVADKIEFAGFVPNDKLPQLMQTFDVFVHPSLSVSESFGVVVLEAEACGVPVVATNVGGVPEVCIDGKTGFLIPVKDSKSIADKVILLAKNSELRKKMSTEARNFVLQDYRWEDNVEKMLRLLKQQADKTNKEFAH